MANPSPWAQNQGPPDPNIWGQAPLIQTAPLDALQGVGASPAPAAPAPAKMAAQPSGDAGQQQISNDQQRLEKIRWQQDNPWGTANNHPGKLGKIAHAFSTLGNIAGDIFAPTTMALIPGTQLNRQVQEHGLAKRLNTEIGDESQNQSRAATTAHEQEETAEAPAKNASEEGLQDATTDEKRQDLANGPSLATAYSHRVNEVLKNGGDPSTDVPTQHLLQAMQAAVPQKETQPKGMEHVAGMMNGKPAFGNFHPDTGQYTDPQGNPMSGFQPQPQPALLGPVGVDNTGLVSRATPGKELPGGFRTISQEGSLNSPTTMQRNSGGRADIVLSAIPDVLNDLHTNAAQLGPGMGRFNDIYSGKIGAPNPQFSGLMADLHLMGTAVALAHAQGRMSNELLTEFNNMIASPQQSPQNIEAVLGKVQNYMQRQSDLGSGKGRSPGQSGDAGGKADYVFKDGKLVKQ